MRLLRLIKIILTLHRYGLYQILREYHRTSLFAIIVEGALFFVAKKQKNETLPTRTRLAFEKLGPVFVKFGQLLSTRPDVIPNQFVAELSKLQNQVPPVEGDIAVAIIEKSLDRPLNMVFSQFKRQSVASASIAQVHQGILKSNGQKVAVKVLRPDISATIEQDIRLLRLAAWFVEKAFVDSKRLRLQEVIDEFDKTIHSELDFLQEAANATELYRLHSNDNKIRIPRIFYDYCSSNVIIMEWMDGTQISDIATLKKKNIDLERLSHNGVDIFYTQVFNYGFFHADMHPGNILCDDDGCYIGLDFGIVGCLSDEDKRYLAINILAFFNRDYKKVAITHIESGWAPRNTSVEDLENAIRTVCEPIFNKPLAQISFGQILIKLFQISRRFGIVVQPQLILLQKTIVNIEGLGRMLNPDLDLWVTAKPILEKWMNRQMGIRGFLYNLKDQLPYWSYSLPQLPRMFVNSLVTADEVRQQNNSYIQLVKSYKRQNYFFMIAILLLLIALFFKY